MARSLVLGSVLGVFVASVVCAGPVVGQTQHLWRETGASGANVARSISVGADGTQVATNVEGGGGAVALFQGNASVGSSLIWSSGQQAAARPGLVRSARNADQHVSLRFDPAETTWYSYTPRIEARRSGVSAPAWSRSFSSMGSSPTSLPCGLHVADDGARVVAWWFDTATMSTRIVCLDAAGVVLSQVVHPIAFPPLASAVTGDGATLFLTTVANTLALRTADGAVTSTLVGFGQPTGALAASAAGERVYVGNSLGGVDAFQRTSSSWTYAWSLPPLPGLLARRASTGGGLLSVAYQSPTNARDLRVRIHDVAAAGQPLLCTDALSASGNLGTYFTDIECSSTGETVCVGTSGDETGDLPELLVYRRTAGGAVYRELAQQLPGSVLDLEISRNGRTLGVVSSLQHATLSTYWSAVDVYDLGGDVAVVGVPHLATDVNITVRSDPGRRCLLISSPTLANAPVGFPGLGLLHLGSPTVVAAAFADGQGIARFQVAIPGSSSALGTCVYYQGMSLVARRLSESWVAVRPVP